MENPQLIEKYVYMYIYTSGANTITDHDII
jgi:hypothetical protein